VCLSDTNKQLGKHRRLLCSLPHRALLIGSSGRRADSHGSSGLERDDVRGTEQELQSELGAGASSAYGGSSDFGGLDLSIADLCDQVRPSHSPLPPHS